MSVDELDDAKTDLANDIGAVDKRVDDLGTRIDDLRSDIGEHLRSLDGRLGRIESHLIGERRRT
jgi:hypothetical protein